MKTEIKRYLIKIKKFKFFRHIRLLNIKINKFNYETSFKIREYIYYALIFWIIILFVNIQKEVFVNIYNKINEGGTLFTILKEIINKINATGILFTILIVMIIGMFYFMKIDYKKLIRKQKREKKAIKDAEKEKALREKIEQDQIHENEIKEFQKEIIERLANAIESKDGSTGNHVRRVAEYSKLLAYLLPKELKLTDKEIEELSLISPLHDIGKIAIPDDILKKPDVLNKREKRVIQTHSQHGYEILKDSNIELIKKAEMIAYQHHEKWDGSGYPKNLKGKDIHILSRITAIVDVFDALSSERVYKKAWSQKRIRVLFKLDLRNAKRGKGKIEFDPVLNHIFILNLPEFYKIKLEYPEDGKYIDPLNYHI